MIHEVLVAGRSTACILLVDTQTSASVIVILEVNPL